jgi:cytochrome c peroxidase
MPHARRLLGVVRPGTGRFALAPPGGRFYGLVLTGVGISLLVLASIPMLVGAATPPTCKADGTDTVQCVFDPEAEEGTPLSSLRNVVKPVDSQLNPGGDIVRNQGALVALGKALFWDQQVGSDGQACGSCHFSAGADARTINQISPGLKAQPTADTTFQVGPPNDRLTTGDFPIHQVQNPDVHGSRVLRDANDTIASAGVFRRDFVGIQANSGGVDAPQPAFDMKAFDVCSSVSDEDNFKLRGVNVRRVEPRNTPTMINALFANRQFWDSRAQDVFNGVNPFGARDPKAVVWRNGGGSTTLATAMPLRITFSGLASQAVGPPLSEFEMSCLGRTFPDLGHKLLTSTNTPLAQQDVDPNDSVLGPISNARIGRTNDGLFVSYGDLVRASFQPRWWNSNVAVDTTNTSTAAGKRPQIEANFSMFWGIAVQAYMETLRADQAPVDSFFEGHSAALDSHEKRGLQLFQSAKAEGEAVGHTPDLNNPSVRVVAPIVANGQPADLRCTACHGGAETTSARIDAIRNDARLERMAMPNPNHTDPPPCAIYDGGHFNTGVRRTNDDLGLGASDPFGHSFAETTLAIQGTLATLVPTATLGTSGSNFGLAPALVTTGGKGTTNCDGPNVNGTFKAPSLRNVELTGPYFHNGGQLTLRQVVDFYNRGGDFDNPDFDPNVHALGLGPQDEADLVSFLMALTDERVALEQAPFDHPQICVANGEQTDRFGNLVTGPDLPGPSNGVHQAADNVECFGATGAGGRRNRLPTFLGVNEFDPSP